MHKRLLYLSLFLNCCFVFFFIGKRFYYTHTSLFHPKPTFIADPVTVDILKCNARTELFRHLPCEPGDIVFVGNSITEQFPLQEMFATLKVKNRGIGGNTTRDVLARLPDIVKSAPAKLFLEIGINDVIQGRSPDEIADDISAICDTIRKGSPTTRLYVQSLLPANFKEKLFTKRIEAVNEKIKNNCMSKSVMFLNLYPSFQKDGGMNPALTYDGVHLTSAGYKLLKELLAPCL